MLEKFMQAGTTGYLIWGIGLLGVLIHMMISWFRERRGRLAKRISSRQAGWYDVSMHKDVRKPGMWSIRKVQNVGRYAGGGVMYARTLSEAKSWCDVRRLTAGCSSGGGYRVRDRTKDAENRTNGKKYEMWETMKTMVLPAPCRVKNAVCARGHAVSTEVWGGHE